MASIIKANQLQDFGGNSILTSDGAGNVTPNASGIKNTPAFALRKSSDQSISTGANTLITWDVAQIDTASGFDNSADSYTIPAGQGGTYFCTLAVGWSSDSRVILSIEKNGAAVVASDGEDGNNLAFQNFSCILNLSAGDVLKTYYYMVSSGGPIREKNNSGQYVTRFEGFKLIGS
jgi:hypothetical protein